MVNTNHIFRIDANLEPPIDIGEVPGGYRRVIPIKGGTVEGTKLNGIVLPGGADWNLVRTDGASHFWARYTLQTDDGVNIVITNEGQMPGNADDMARLAAGEIEVAQGAYAWGTPSFEVASEKYAFLNERIFLSTLTPTSALSLFIDVYEVVGRI